jgi:hypothetical protein
VLLLLPLLLLLLVLVLVWLLLCVAAWCVALNVDAAKSPAVDLFVWHT